PVLVYVDAVVAAVEVDGQMPCTVTGWVNSTVRRFSAGTAIHLGLYFMPFGIVSRVFSEVPVNPAELVAGRFAGSRTGVADIEQV
ncbi:MAG: hypothetical protein HN750_11730, partial [Gemmatimonadales bacterium]|nr:hypothetical protein [Gemmatimonadales bacterium]